MPYAKAVSAKTYDFDDRGLEAEIDYEKMMRIVLDAGYRGFVGVEYEGSGLSEAEGIRANQAAPGASAQRIGRAVQLTHYPLKQWSESLTVVLLLLLVHTSGYGQASSFLMFEKSRNRRAFYYPGDEISLQLRGDRSKFTGRIQELQDSVILFEYYRVRVSDVTHIYQDDNAELVYAPPQAFSRYC